MQFCFLSYFTEYTLKRDQLFSSSVCQQHTLKGTFYLIFIFIYSQMYYPGRPGTNVKGACCTDSNQKNPIQEINTFFLFSRRTLIIYNPMFKHMKEVFIDIFFLKGYRRYILSCQGWEQCRCSGKLPTPNEQKCLLYSMIKKTGKNAKAFVSVYLIIYTPVCMFTCEITQSTSVNRTRDFS